MNTGRKILFVVVDLLLSLCAIALSILIRFEGEIPLDFLAGSKVIFFSMALACVIAFYLYGLYEKVWRYAGMHELLTIVAAVSIGLAPFFLFALITGGKVYPRGIIIIAWFVNIFFLGGLRFLLRLAGQGLMMRRVKPGKRVLIVGANDVGEMVLREMQRQIEIGYIPIGLIDDDPSKRHVLIHGVPVLGKKEDIPAIILEKGIDELIIALTAPLIVRDIVMLCEKLKVGLKIIPSLSEMIDGRISVSQIREVQIEDLLERDPVKLDIAKMSEYLKDKRVLVTGAGGSIGSEICRQVIQFLPAELMLLGHGENSIYEIWVELSNRTSVPLKSFIGDIRDMARMSSLFSHFRPQVVFHAAAHKHVPIMEENIIEALTNNIFGTRNLVKLADSQGVERFIFLSTDKAVNPVSIMGASKRVAEMIVFNSCHSSRTKFVTVRFGNVLGSRGSVVPTFRHQIRMGGPITVTHEDMSRYFMTIPEAVQLVIQAGVIGEGGEIFILDMGKPIKILDLAKNMVRLSGLEVDHDIKISIQGIRSGEKLEEELVNRGENIEKTSVDKIFKVRSCEIRENELESFLSGLEGAIREQDEIAARKMLFEHIARLESPA